jgi:hypothetical protein
MADQRMSRLTMALSASHSGPIILCGRDRRETLPSFSSSKLSLRFPLPLSNGKLVIAAAIILRGICPKVAAVKDTQSLLCQQILGCIGGSWCAPPTRRARPDTLPYIPAHLGTNVLGLPLTLFAAPEEQYGRRGEDYIEDTRAQDRPGKKLKTKTLPPPSLESGERRGCARGSGAVCWGSS